MGAARVLRCGEWNAPNSTAQHVDVNCCTSESVARNDSGQYRSDESVSAYLEETAEPRVSSIYSVPRRISGYIPLGFEPARSDSRLDISPNKLWRFERTRFSQCFGTYVERSQILGVNFIEQVSRCISGESLEL